jgi:hypothetical protein
MANFTKRETMTVVFIATMMTASALPLLPVVH